MSLSKGSLTEFIQKHVELAVEPLRNLVILRYEDWVGGGLAVVGNPNGGSCYRCDVILTPSKHLVLTGDLDTMVWGRFTGEGGVKSAIHWIASSDIHYAKQKASIGMTDIGHEEFNLSVARWEANNYLQQGICVEKWNDIVVALEGCDDWDIHSVARLIHETMDDDDVTMLGMVPSQRLLWAWSFLHKVDELFSQRDSVPCWV